MLPVGVERTPQVETVWVIVNYDDHDQPVYGVYKSHATASTDYKQNFPPVDFPNLRLEEWAVL